MKVTITWQGGQFQATAEGETPTEVVKAVEEIRTALGQGESEAQKVESAQPNGESCPMHKIARPSKRGGLYCPTKLESGGYCSWTRGSK